MSKVLVLTTPQRTPYQYWLLLLLMGTVTLGCSFVYDVPQALQTQFQSKPMNLDYFEFDLLYSVYSIPNVILPIVGGCLLKILGVRLGIIIFAFLVLQGQVVFSLGVFWKDYYSMIIGRVIYALGAESLYIAQLALAVQLFSKQELTFVLGWNNSVTYLANVINSLFTPGIYLYTQKLWAPCIFGAILCVISLVCGFLIINFEKEPEKKEPVDTVNPLITLKKQFTKDLRKVSTLFWGLLFYYMVTFPGFKAFTSNMNDQVHKRFGFSNIAAGQLGLLYYLQLIIVSPIVGTLTDTHGKRLLWLTISGTTALLGHVLFAWLRTQASQGFIVIIPLFLLGAADAIFETTSWSCLCIALGEELTEMGFGIATAGMNAMTVAVLVLLGKIGDDSRQINFGYFYSELFLEGLAGISLVVLLIVAVLDFKNGAKLDRNYADDVGIEIKDMPKQVASDDDGEYLTNNSD